MCATLLLLLVGDIYVWGSGLHYQVCLRSGNICVYDSDNLFITWFTSMSAMVLLMYVFTIIRNNYSLFLSSFIRIGSMHWVCACCDDWWVLAPMFTHRLVSVCNWYVSMSGKVSRMVSLIPPHVYELLQNGNSEYIRWGEYTADISEG